MRICRFCDDSGLVRYEPVNPGANFVTELCSCAKGREVQAQGGHHGPTSAELMDAYDDLHGGLVNDLEAA